MVAKGTLHPPGRPIDEFERAIERLNEACWFLRAAAALTSKAADGEQRLTTLVPPDIAKHLDVTVGEITALAPAAERAARYAMLVQVITAYEEYLTEELTIFLTAAIKTTKQYTSEDSTC